MSRVLFLSLEEGEVVRRCHAAKVGISAIERLPAGGTRVVCMSGDGAALLKKKLKSHLLSGNVTRQEIRPSTPIW
jgi:hypothetical protein